MAGSLHGLTLLLCLCLCCWRTHGQVVQAPTDGESYPDLTTYPLPAKFGGVFTYPNQITQVYDEGSTMNIAWNTTYQYISLYVAYVHNISLAAPVDGSGNSQRQLQTNTPSNSSDEFPWGASCDPDCNSPYQFHIVNSRGTLDEVTQEGFWSDYFWIRPSSRAATDSSTATSTTSSTTASVSSASSTTSTSAPPTTPTSEAVTPTPSPKETESSGLSTGAIVGISIGATAIVLCAIGLGIFCCAMKKKKDREEKVPPHAPVEGSHEGLPRYFDIPSREQGAVSPHKPLALDTMQPMHQAPTELAATQSPTELETTRWR